MDKRALIEHFDKVAHNNRALIKGDIRGIMLFFRGLGYALNAEIDTCSYEMCAENGVLFIFPQYNPTCWMNQKTVNYVDAIVDAAIEINGLDDRIPVGISGGSMGGYCAFHYAMKSKHNIVALGANCPCVNMEYETYTSSLPVMRTYFESSLEDTDDFAPYVRENSPLNMVEKLPRIPYRVSIGMKDATLYPTLHAIPMVEKMIAAGHDVTRVDYPEMGHCNYSNEERVKEHKWVVEKITEK